MSLHPHFHHIAVQCNNKKEALLFYQNVLGLDFVKSFTLDHHLAQEIFSITKDIDVYVFQNESLYIEVFIYENKISIQCNHIGILVENIADMIHVCKKAQVEYFSVEKDDKQLWFVKDFSGNLFEIKQKQ